MSIIRWLILFIGLAFSLSWLFYQYYKLETTEHLNQHTLELETAYKAVIHNYRLSTETLYYEVLLKPDILNLFEQGIKAKGQEKQVLRSALYQKLKPTYQRLRKRNLKQLHFHEPGDARSFLRFHKPDKYGDLLIDVRHSLQVVNQDKVPVYGFEMGRVYSGFRYIYPLFSPNSDPKNYIGSVETSVSFKGVEKELYQLVHADFFDFLLKGDMVFKVVFDAFKERYAPAIFAPNYFYEDESMINFKQKIGTNPLKRLLNQKLQLQTDIQEKMNQGDAFASSVCYSNNCYAISFAPVLDVNKQQVAYLIAYNEDTVLRTLQQRLYIQTSISNLALLVIFLLIWRYQKSQQALHSNEMKLTAIFDNAQVGIGLLDPSGFYMKANQHFLNLFGYNWEELRRMHCKELHHPLYQEDAEYMLRQIINNNIKYLADDKQFVRKNAQVFWGHHNLSALYDTKGDCIAVVCIITDFTEHKKNSEMLHKLSRAVEQSHNIVVITNLKGDIEFINPAFTTTTGYSETEVLGKNPRILKSGKLKRSLYEELWSTLTQGKTWHGEFYNRRKNGKCYWEAATISPIKDSFGHVQYYIAVKEDISERKQSEVALQHKNKVLHQLNQEKNEFLAIAAHDLKNPLAAIQSLADEISFEEVSMEEINQYANEIKAASQKMFGLVTNLLDVNAIESGEIQLEKEISCIQPLVKRVLQQYKRAAEQKQISLKLHTVATDFYANISEDTFMQILDNLISNAVKYSPFHGRIDVFLKQKNGLISCSIQDQGEGLSREEQALLFGKFSRLSPKPTNGEHSTGLGLFIVKKLVEALDGQVHCISKLGEGSLFVVEFPACTPPPVLPKSLDPIINIDSHLKILLVEDNAVNRMVAKLLLKKLGLSADEAIDGQEAVNFCLKKQYDIILMDIHMPKLNGVLASQKILQNSSDHKPHIVALTATQHADDQQLFEQAGIKSYITKPVKKETLAQIFVAYQASIKTASN